MKMKLHTACAALVAALTASVVASAASAQDLAWSGNFGLTTDYVFRGVSQSGGDPAPFAGVDVTYGSFYAGAWGSSVDFGDGTDIEVDLYGGFRTEAAGYALDFGVVGYLYNGAPGGVDYDYVEFKAAASRAIGPATLGAAVFYSPDFFGADDSATYVEANAAYAIAPGWTVSGAVGHQFLDVSDDYTTWNVGAGYALAENVVLDGRYHDTDIDGLGIAEERFVFTVKASF
jgi:uncharacterized protein (TIGR02001 family)